MPPLPAKPDPRARLIMLVVVAFGTGLAQIPAGTTLLTAYPVALGLLLGSSRLLLQLAGSYVALRALHHLCLSGVHLPLVSWLGTLLVLSVYGFPTLVVGLMVFIRVLVGEAAMVLGRLWLPDTFLVVVMVIYRYVPALLGELRTIRSAFGLWGSEARRCR